MLIKIGDQYISYKKYKKFLNSKLPFSLKPAQISDSVW